MLLVMKSTYPVAGVGDTASAGFVLGPLGMAVLVTFSNLLITSGIVWPKLTRPIQGAFYSTDVH